ncbi:acyl carrier protein [Clostridium sp. DJ247]|uniref:acyl carrier protein n=1 Tax=Clostridium sp. DJ247 TaxID=2726188 RepID=UPI001623FEB2|nr:acyl carrier protein [Clostridium sp. DJ247]MBC2580263.1 acyl carrier protein [Clostridium sp. DJ247]
MKDKILKILEQVLNENITHLKDDDIIPDKLENWDSLKHLSLITALEDEFNIILSPEEIIHMNRGLKYIIDTLIKHGVN